MSVIGFLHLTVIEEDEAINVPPENVTVEVGKTAIMTCESHGNLKDYTSWVKLESTDDDQDTVESFTVLKEASEHLEIKNVTHQSEGIYACVVGNSVASVMSVAHLSVNDPIAIALPKHHMNMKVSFVILHQMFYLGKYLEFFHTKFLFHKI